MLIINGTIITGDTRTVIPDGFLLIRDGHIKDFGGGAPPRIENEKTIDASNSYIIPGLINTHAHACCTGPLSPAARESLSIEEVLAEHHRHILNGETSVLHLCGFCLQSDVDLVGQSPLHVKVGTSHLPSCIRAAELVDGKGLFEPHLQITAKQRLKEGAVAIGEIGAGNTLGGGAQDYLYLPNAVKKVTGIILRADQARELKWAVLGKNIRMENFDSKQTELCLNKFGLEEYITCEEARTIVCDTVLPPMQAAIKGYEEAALLSAQTGVPAILHNGTAVVEEIARLKRKYPKARLVAGHSNAADFDTEDALIWCKRLKDMGLIVDAATWDLPTTAIQADPEKFRILLREGLIDTVSTDYAGGKWDPIIKGLAMIIRDRVLSPAKAFALATGNVAGSFPDIFGDRGVIAKEKVADIVIIDSDEPDNVSAVFIGGEQVVRNGQLAADKM
jgi:imidazolonepropionase-like amidohydrolase